MKLQSLLAGCEWGWGRISVEIIPLNLYFRLRRNIKKYQGTSIETACTFGRGCEGGRRMKVFFVGEKNFQKEFCLKQKNNLQKRNFV